eukprot:jgi/Chrzof1/5433/Cz16g02240.t1
MMSVVIMLLEDMGVTLWGFWDANIWTVNGGIYRKDGTPKPAATALQRLWSKTWNTTLTNKVIGDPSPPPPAPTNSANVATTPAANCNPNGNSIMERILFWWVWKAATPTPVDCTPPSPPAPPPPPPPSLAGEIPKLKFRGFYGKYAYQFYANGRQWSGTLEFLPEQANAATLLLL